MMIFIPMSGFGDRYRRAGYTDPKPLIPVDGVPMIERIVAGFPKDSRFIFAINREHAQTTPLQSELQRIAPQGTIVVIEPHKDGPAATVIACEAHLPDDEPVLLNYCDFGVDWSFEAFESWAMDGGWDGAMTAYRGFHPHSLGPTLYAYMRNDGDRVLEIREKHHFTSDKFKEYASSGLYWFRRGADLKRLARALVSSGERVNQEFYISMVMQHLIAEGGRVGVYPLAHFYQWGTPEDLRDYEGWARAMRDAEPLIDKARKVQSPSAQVMPMAGLGQRFLAQGYDVPKPLIDVAGRPMMAQSVAFLPTPTQRVLVARTEHTSDPRFTDQVAAMTPETEVLTLNRVTEGQAISAKLGLMQGVDLDAPVLIAPCDTGCTYDLDAWSQFEHSPNADLVVWTAKGHLPAIWRPQMYGWVHTVQGEVKRVAVKQPVQGIPLSEQEVVLGTFWFKTGALFLKETEAMVADNDRVNGEFYIDTLARRMMQRGYRVRTFTVDKYIPWGTPEELKTFHYWNDVFRQGRKLL